jgi:hypothetical protein
MSSESIPLAQEELQLLLTPSRTDLPLPYNICALASKRKNSVFTKTHFGIYSKTTSKFEILEDTFAKIRKCFLFLKVYAKKQNLPSIRTPNRTFM